MDRFSKKSTMAIKDIADSLYADNPGKTLFHYTSLTGLLGIVDSQSLWASDILFLNDAAEMIHTFDLLREEISLRMGQEERNFKLFGQFRDWIKYKESVGVMIFAVSLTGNGNLLSQWRSYCPLGKGVSVGFHHEILSRCAQEQSFAIGKCIYEWGRQKEIIQQIIDHLETLAETMGENKDLSKCHPNNSYQHVFETMEKDLLRIGALLKHPAFKEEEEWRAVSPVISDAFNSPIQYREGNSMLIPYLEFSLVPEGEPAMRIQTVVLGPTPNVNNSIRSLLNCLNKKGAPPLTNALLPCNIPFRERY